MLLVVCDSTPLIYLAKLGHFNPLHRLHEAVLRPAALWQEVAVQGAQLEEGRLTRRAQNEGWLAVERPKGSLTVSATELEDLDPGEAEAIQLAIEHGALLAIDEAYGRKVATRLGLKITGTVGLLARGRKERFIGSLRLELDKLRTQTTFRLSDEIYRNALASVGEQIQP